MKVAFIGLGNMGFPMAGHLAAGGHELTVYNRTAAKAEAWTEKHGGAHAETPAAAAEGAEIAFVCVGNDDDLRSVVFGPDGVLAGLDKGAILVDHTTASAGLAREIAEAGAGDGIDFLDAVFSLQDLDLITDIRGFGLLAGLDLAPGKAPGMRGYAALQRFYEAGLMVKMTGDCVLLSPPLVIENPEIDFMVDTIRGVVEGL